MKNDDNIHSRAMLVRLSISVWSARRFDRQVTQEVNNLKQAGPDAGRWNRHLFGGRKGSPSHAAIEAAAMAARAKNYEQTLPWDDAGWRLLPSSNYFEYAKAMRAVLGRFESAVAAFVADYPELRKQARTRLGRMFHPDDYPEQEDVARRFRASIEYTPVPISGDFRLDLPDDVRKEVEASVEERVSRATRAAVQDAWSRLGEAVEKIHERLSDPDKRFHASMISNTAELVNILSRLNVTEDEKLEELRARVEADLSKLDAQELRDNPDRRAEAARKAEKILKAMAGVYGSAAV